ncbi:MAG TPA: histidine kinase [Phnomibacter sp.]|nr:histidine kinase [Phnomibacter sp.]
MKRAQLLFHTRLISSAIAFSVVVFLIFIYINVGYFRFEFLYRFFLRDTWPLFLQTILLFYFLTYTTRYFDRRFSRSPNSFTRFAIEIAFVFLGGTLFSEVVRQLLIHFIIRPEADIQLLEQKIRQVFIVNITVLAALYGFITSLRIFKYLQQKQVELLRAKKDLTLHEFDVLKNKLNPHFLFNSLSTLSSLVYTDPGVAEAFVLKLSRTYRYILEQRDRETVSLSAELDFLEHYVFLLEQRFGKKLQVHRPAPMATNCLVLPPHSFLIVMEYILAHQAMSAAEPLVIDISADGEGIRFTYADHPRASSQPATTGQFDKLKEQYAFLTKDPVTETKAGGMVTILLPLITESK